MPDAEIAVTAGRFFEVASVLDVTGHAPGHSCQESIDRLGFAFGHELDLAGRQVLDVTRYREILSDALRRVPETDALDPARVENTLADNHRAISVRSLPRVGASSRDQQCSY